MSARSLLGRLARSTKAVPAVVALLAAAACGAPLGGSAGGAGEALGVVAAEGSWGGIASQLGGSRVRVRSVVRDPNADPHEYQATAADARAFAQADLVILNGAGYDGWGQKLLAAGGGHRRVLTVAAVAGKKSGDNPHLWYDPPTVEAVADRITAQYRTLDPAGASYYEQRRAEFSAALRPYHARIAEIKQKFGGAKIGATESVFDYMAAALGLEIISPPAFRKAVAESADPPAVAVATFQDQLAQKQVAVLVYNVQTATAVTTNARRLAAAWDIPVVGVSESPHPETASFQDWQLAQLDALEKALATRAAAR